MKFAAQINSSYLYAINSSVLFGASTPAAKYFLGKIHPILLAGLFYLGCSANVARITHTPGCTLHRIRDIVNDKAAANKSITRPKKTKQQPRPPSNNITGNPW